MALARARVNGPLGRLGGLGAVASVGRAVSAPPPLRKESSSTLESHLHELHGMVRAPPL